MADIGYAGAFASGVISINTPCAGVIAPAFLAHLAGVGVLAWRVGAPSEPPPPECLGQQSARLKAAIILGSLSFALSFALVFVLLGSSLGGLADWVQGSREGIGQVGGAVIILFGLLVTGMIPLPGTGVALGAVTASRYAASLLTGVGFAIGWTPCVNEGLGKVLTLSNDPTTSGEGARLLSAYSGGLMLPFLAASVAAALVAPSLLRHAAPRRAMAIVAGIALIALGALVFTNRFVELTGYLFSITS